MNDKKIGAFYITNKKGFHIRFENGWTVSVQFGPANYCDNYNMRIGQEEELAGESGSTNAECAVWGPGEKLFSHPLFHGDTVGNRMRPAEVLDLMNWAASQPMSKPSDSEQNPGSDQMNKVANPD